MDWWILLSVLLLLVLIFTILLLTNLVLFIDTRQHLYELRFGKILDARLVLKENHPGIDLRVFWMHFFLDFFTMGTSGEKKDKKEKKRKKKKAKSLKPQKIWKIVKAVFRSFRVRRLELNLDTESGVWNGLLIPLQYINKRPEVSVQINWIGERYLVMQIENSAGRIGWAVARVFIFGR